MINLIIVILIIIMIFFVSQSNIKKLGHLLHYLFHSTTSVVKWLSFILLPGTFLHEIGHLVFAEAMFVKTDDLNLIPQIREDSVKMGGVKIQQTDIIRRTIIGIAPVLFGVIVIWTGTYFFLTNITNLIYWPIYIYLMFQITHTMFASRKDLEGAFLGYTVILLLLYFIKYLSELVKISYLDGVTLRINSFFNLSFPYLLKGLLIGLAIDIAVFIILTMLLKITAKKS